MQAPSVSNLIDIESPDFNSQLQFQDFSASIPNDSSNIAKLPINNPVNSPSGNNLPNTAEFTSKSSDPKSFWTWEYFQQFFDVTTDVVIERVKASVIPQNNVNYLQQYIKNKPDLYGPVWICITLVFSIAISGNIANYLQATATHVYHWKYEFHIVTSAASAIICYAWVLPVVLWAYLKYQGQQETVPVSALELLCIYGYSLSIYIPISVLWVIQVNWLQWFLVGTGAAISGYILLTSIAPALGQKNYPLLAVLTTLHLLLAAGFMWYFFHVPEPHYSPKIVQTVAAAPSVSMHTNITH
ncbi:unnamed protein product [Bemisia tabaci]|uniref:Protein YIPF n=1 Tax=Bemisia tabaci TaxID=7038 RepID=A0A9P0F1C0_BEMTA|nr:unnamed protein product [Bemisia tabaci]